MMRLQTRLKKGKEGDVVLLTNKKLDYYRRGMYEIFKYNHGEWVGYRLTAGIGLKIHYPKLPKVITINHEDWVEVVGDIPPYKKIEGSIGIFQRTQTINSILK